MSIKMKNREGRYTFVSGAAFAVPHLLAMLNADGSVSPCDNATEPLGESVDTPSAAGEETAVELFSGPGTKLGVAGAAVARGDALVATAGGKIIKSAGSGYFVGTALEAADANGVFEYDPRPPRLLA